MGKRSQVKQRKAVQQVENKRGRKKKDEVVYVASSSDARTADSALPIRGLNNLGNTCFFNSAVQSLAATPPLEEYLREELAYHPGPVTYAWLNTLRQLRAGSGTSSGAAAKKSKGVLSSFSPGTLHSAVVKVAPQFAGFRQHDSHELFISLISAVHDEAVAKAKVIADEPRDEEDAAQDGPPEVKDLSQVFEGHLLNVVQCKHCEQRSFKVDEIYDISLQIPSANYARQAPSPKFKKKKKLDSKAASGKASATATDPLLELINMDLSAYKKKDRTAMKKKQKKALQEYKRRLADEAFRKEKEAQLGEVKPVVVDATSNNDNAEEDGASANAAGNAARVANAADASRQDGHTDDKASEGAESEEDNNDDDQDDQDDAKDDAKEEEEEEEEEEEQDGGEDGQDDWEEERQKRTGHRVQIGQSVESWLAKLSAPEAQPQRPSTQFDGACSLHDCLDAFSSWEELSRGEGNGYLCEKCNRGQESEWVRRDASKRMCILSPPENLVLHLKRLLPGRKISHTVTYPARLNLAPYCMVAMNHHSQCPPEAPAHLHAEGTNRESAQCWYDLYAVIVHLGSAYGGHYVAYVRRAVQSAGRSSGDSESSEADEAKEGKEEEEEADGDVRYQWYYASDSLVRRCDEDEAMSAEAYMLFYCKSPIQGE